MAEEVRFDDGAAYERGMGVWSQRAGAIFLDWLAPPAGLRWLDVGCGNGAFSELLMQRCAPSAVQGIDPSEAQLAFARTRPGTRGAVFQTGDAMALPFPGAHFDAAVMALVIFFVPDPAKGVAEMKRVVRPGGIVAAYAWDMYGGGFPFHPIQAELRAAGMKLPGPPSPAASRMDEMRALWTGARLEAIESREIAVERSFADFDEFWNFSTGTGSVKPMLVTLGAAVVDQVKARVRARLEVDGAGRVVCHARANAIKGRLPNA